MLLFGKEEFKKQSTDLRRWHHYMRDGTLAREELIDFPSA